jgi:TatD DNase family protein
VSLVDSHCHLDDEKFDPDRAEVIERALAAGVELMMAIGTGGDLDVAIQQAERYPFIYATIGVHPHDAAKATPDTFARLRDLAGHPKVLAIGEIGLDYHYDFSPRDVQRSVFERQLEIGADFHKPIVIHTREAWEDTLAQISGLPHGGIMHCFTGNSAQAQQALDLGFHLSFGGVLTFPKAEGLRSSSNHARRPSPRRDRLPLSGPSAAPRKAQRTGLRGGNCAPPGGSARRHTGGDRRKYHT